MQKRLLSFVIFFLVYSQLSHAQCVVVPNQTTVYGQVYIDGNQNGTQQPTETFGIPNIGIDLYIDNNTNGVIDSGDVIVDSALSNGVGDYTLVAPEIILSENVQDDFDTVSYSGNNGSQNWTNSWVESGDNNNPSSGTLRVTNALRFGSRNEDELDNIYATRSANLSSYTSATLSFNFNRSSSTEDSYIRLQVSANGVNYYTIDTFSDSDAIQNYSYDISSYISSETYIRFRGYDEIDENRYYYFDNVTIDYQKTGGFFTNYIAAIDYATIPAGTYVTSASFLPITFTDLGQISCDNNFGGFICGPNCTPNAEDDTITILQGDSATINVLANDTDGDGNIDASSLNIQTQPTNGSVTLDGLYNIIYVPNGSYIGTDSFTYEICDTPTLLCATATVNINILENYIDPCFQAVKEQTYYIPFSDDVLRTALINAANSSGCSVAITNEVNRVISIKSPYPGAILTYDHWEDGFEADINNPVQSTTQVWGDDDVTNGTSPNYSSDYIPSGGNIVLQNTYNYNPRNASTIVYDGRDKIQTSNDIALSVVAGDVDRFEVQMAKTDVYNLEKFGTAFIAPFGEDLAQEFQYTALFVRASQAGTEVNIDLDNDGTIDITDSINEGEVTFVDGGVQSGAVVTSSLPVGVDLLFGGLDCIGTRQINILPSKYHSDIYYSPVPTTNVSAPSVVYFYNSLNRSIDLDWSSNINTGTITVPAKSSSSISLSDNSGYKFQSTLGESYVASQVIDADASGSTYDWSFNLISEARLTDFAAIAWAPGSVDGSGNYNPIWVTPAGNTTLYIKYDGDLTDASASTSPCGIPYDQSMTLNALNYAQIFDTFNNDNDQSGMAVYTCDGTKIFAVYGEDPSVAPTASPALDVGTTMQPLCLSSLILANDDEVFCLTNTSIDIPVTNNDRGFLTTLDISSITTAGLLQPTNGNVIANPDGTVTYTPNDTFIGLDTFEYSICSVEFPGVCDTATISIIISDCPAPTYGNLIYGQIYFDLDENLVNDDGIGIENIDVNIYEDVNVSTTVDGGDILLGTVSSNDSGFYNYAVPHYNDEILDAFSSTIYNGGSGWAANWTEVGDDGISTTGDVQIEGTIKKLCVKNDKSIYRTLDLSGATSANISFEAIEFGSIDPTDIAIVEVCSDATFSNCQTIFTNADDFIGTTVNGTVIAPDKLTNTANVRVRTTGYTSSDEFFYIDNLIIRNEINPLNLVIEAETSSIPAGYSFSTDNVEDAQFTAGALGECELPNDFGLIRCNLEESGVTLNCNINGTPKDATDDTYSITINPTGTRLGGTYNITGDITGSGTYGIAQNFGPFLMNSGNKIITITDASGNCSINDIAIKVSENSCLFSNSSTSIDFDGVDDYIEAEAFMNTWTAATIMGWIKIDNTFAPSAPFNRAFGQTPFNIHIDNTLKARAGLYTGTSSTYYQIESPLPLQRNLWYHLTAVYDGANGTFRMYVNGEKLSGSIESGIPNTGISSDPVYGEGNFTIGRDLRNVTYNFKGAIDEVRVFDTVLTEDQIQRMVYQEIEQNGVNVKGKIIQKDVIEGSSNAKIPWINLAAYYPMTDVVKTKTTDKSNYSREAILYNITTIQPQTAPMPYETVSDGPWTTEATWLHGDVWDIEDIPNNKDWNIVNIKNNISTTASHTNLGLIVDNTKTLTVNGDNSITNNWYLQLDGALDLSDDSQLIQSINSDLVTSATGKVLRRQEGNTLVHWYNYWSSPVGALGATSLSDNNGAINNVNNTPFSLNMLKQANGNNVQFTNALSPPLTNPVTISTEWFYTFLNGLTYYNWNAIVQTTAITPGHGYIHKGTGAAGLEQQYIFEGKPNNGTILIAADDVDNDHLGVGESVKDVTLTTSLIGNPYPSALDARQFIADNTGIISGTIQLWEQWAGSSHYLAEYEGGYGYINNLTTERAYQDPEIPIADQIQTQGIKRPTFYIPVGQSFIVEVIADTGDIEFNNGQRVFIKESDVMTDQEDPNYANNGSSFLRSANTEASTEDTAAETQILRLEFGVSSGASRSFVLGFTEDATDGYDYGLDGGLILDPPADDMGSLLNGQQYVIQAFAPYTPDKEIDLVLHASGNFTYTLKSTEISNFPVDQDLFIKDLLTGQSYDLRNSEPYNFTSVAGSFTDRFKVIFQDPATLSTEELINDNTMIFVNQFEDKLYVKQLSNQAKELGITNLLGQSIISFTKISNQNLENGLDISFLNTGIYIFSITLENNQTIDKKLIVQ